MNILETIEKYILYVVVGIFGVFVLVNSTAPVLLPKIELVVACFTLILIIWLVKSYLKRSVSFAAGRFDLGVALVALTYLAATILRTPNKMEAFLIPGVTTFVVVSAVAYFVINQSNKKVKEGVGLSLFISGLLVSLFVLFTQVNIFGKIPQLPTFIKDPLFNTLGGTIPTIIFLIPALTLGIAAILREKDSVKKIFWGVSAAIIVMAIVVSIGNSLPGKPQALKIPSIQTSWEVGLETIKQSPLLGIGPGNYLTAFNLYRSVTYNQTDLWSLRFTTGSDFYFTALTETGLIGFGAFLILLYSLYKFMIKSPNFEKLALLTLVVLFALFPVSPILLFPFFVLLSINSNSEVNVTHTSVNRTLLGIVGIILLSGILAFDFFGVKAVLAESAYNDSLTALSNNNGAATYTLMQKAVTQEPNVDRYHASLAQVEMAIASGIAAKKDITDTDKTTITQLVQQAINEGKATVTLNPQRSGNWEVLAQIYRSIMPFAQGADQFTIQTYSQAVALDPTNPNLRIALGGVYYALGNYDSAIDSFKLAVLAKGDLANAHYNLSAAYSGKKDYDNAITEMNTVLTLVPKSSPDYTTAQNALTELQKQKPAPSVKTTEGQGQELTAPQPVGPSNVKPPITLPSEATPPAATQ